MRLLCSCLAALLLLLITATCSSASIDQFAGSWNNVDPNTSGITKIEIAASGTSAQVHVWGRCHPSDCDWGTVKAQAFASSVSSDLAGADTLIAVFDSGFSETTLVMELSGNTLIVDSYDRFTDGSGRSNYLANYKFQKAPAQSEPTPGGTAPGAVIPGETVPGSVPSVLDLTGVWNCDDGGIYYVRQLGTIVWWFGENDPNYPGWSNVMRGSISGSTINADWTDVPKGSVMQYGNLVLQIKSNNRLVAVSKTGGFSGSVWTR
ncbi:MAG: hypothetical protein LUQ59_00825 [Methanothrix sp.]|nr:hypothetical protein [Methanothrix sp.]